MQRIRCLITIFVFTYISSTAHAQYQSLQFKHLTPNEGLTQGVAETVFTDSKGFVWITGLDGINRFDGLKCLSNNQIAPGLEAITQTKAIVEDSNGDILFGYAKGIIRYSYQLNRFELIPLPIPPEFINNGKQYLFAPLLAYNSENLIVKLGETLTFIYNHKKRTTKNIYPETAEPISYAFSTKNTTTLSANFYRIHKIKDSFRIYRFTGVDKQESWQLASEFPYNELIHNVSRMYDDSTFVFASSSAILKYHLPSKRLEKKPLPNLNINSVAIDRNKNIWVGTFNQGLYVIQGSSLHIIAHFKYEPGNTNGPSAVQLGVTCDQSGNIWVVAWGKGVDYCNLSDIKFKSDFTNEQIKYYGTTNFIRDIEEDEDGNFYCSLHGGGIIQINKDLEFIKQVPGIDTKLICPDFIKKNNSLYIGTDVFDNHSLIKYDLHKGALHQIRHKSNVTRMANKVYQFSKLSDGQLLAATYNGLWKLNTVSDEFENIPGITVLDETTTFSYEDKHGNIYKGKVMRGLDVYSKSNNGYKKIFSLEENITIKHCYEANDSLIWIGTTNGLYLFNILKCSIQKHFTTSNGLVNNIIYAIIPDEKENLWFSTNKGLSYLYVAKDSFAHFYKSDGLQGSEFNTHAVVKARDGRIIFAGVNGLTTVNNAMLQRKPCMPTLQITGIKTDSSINAFLFDEQHPLKLQAGSNAVEFELTAIDFINPASCKIKYRLKGYDSSWTIIPNHSIARFVKLPAGKYMFEAIASDATGNWDTVVKRIPVFIAAYWWQTNWFKAALFILIIIAVGLAIRMYIRSKINKQKSILEKQFAVQKERERIITDLHDDIGATLSSMNIYSDLAANVWESQPQESRKLIEKITSTSKDLMGRMGDIIWSMKPADEDKYTLEAKLKNYSSELLSPKNIQCDFFIDEKLAATIVNPEVRKNILLIAKEAINNIAKYSGASNAAVSLQQEKQDILLSITDNGIGYEAKKINYGNGMQNIVQRCKSLGGNAEINAVLEKGVSIRCRFPITIISH